MIEIFIWLWRQKHQNLKHSTVIKCETAGPWGRNTVKIETKTIIFGVISKLYCQILPDNTIGFPVKISFDIFFKLLFSVLTQLISCFCICSKISHWRWLKKKNGTNLWTYNSWWTKNKKKRSRTVANTGADRTELKYYFKIQ